MPRVNIHCYQSALLYTFKGGLNALPCGKMTRDLLACLLLTENERTIGLMNTLYGSNILAA